MKPGDKVKCIDAKGFSGLHVGETYTVFHDSKNTISLVESPDVVFLKWRFIEVKEFYGGVMKEDIEDIEIKTSISQEVEIKPLQFLNRAIAEFANGKLKYIRIATGDESSLYIKEEKVLDEWISVLQQFKNFLTEPSNNSKVGRALESGKTKILRRIEIDESTEDLAK